MEDDMMNINEITRLIEWLEANGHSHAEAIECIQYINATQPPQKKEKPTAPQTK